MFNIVLYQPEIPPNTGNIIRLCSNIGASLHLIKPLGFSMEDKYLKRANLDYELQNPPLIYDSFEDYLKTHLVSTIYLCTTKAQKIYSTAHFKTGDSLVFGPESRGLPQEILEQFTDEQKIRIPMQTKTRSLNLSNAVAIVAYEAWRQNNYHF